MLNFDHFLWRQCLGQLLSLSHPVTLVAPLLSLPAAMFVQPLRHLWVGHCSMLGQKYRQGYWGPDAGQSATARTATALAVLVLVFWMTVRQVMGVGRNPETPSQELGGEWQPLA